MLDAIVKTRIVLSANTETNIDIDCLMNDEDLSYSLKREDLETISKKSFDSIR